MDNNFLVREIGRQSDIAHILVPQALDSLTAYQLLDTVGALAQTGFSKYIINLEDVEYISSTGIEMLYRLQQEFREQYGIVLVSNIPDKIYHVFDKIGVMHILDITQSFEQAVEKLTA